MNDNAPEGTPVMHKDGFVRGKGLFMITEFVATEERTNDRFPLLLTTGRILTQYNVGAQTRRTPNEIWHDEDVLEIHPWDAENRGIADGDLVSLASRAGETTLHAVISERMQPGVVYTTFHHPESAANVVTTEFADWATDCPEYKVTAVQVRRAYRPSDWQAALPRAARGDDACCRPSGRGASGMDAQNMLHKANTIRSSSRPTRTKRRLKSVANHIRLYWVPRMRQQIIDYVEKDGGAGLHELAIEAVKRLPAPVVR